MWVEAPLPSDSAVICISRAHPSFPSGMSGPNALSSQEEILVQFGIKWNSTSEQVHPKDVASQDT